jgi:transposase InsO family protein
VRRLRETHDIRCKRHKRFKVTTNSDHKKPVYDNHLKQQFEVEHPNMAWSCDITYVLTDEGWLYVAGVKDLHTKELVGYCLSSRMTADIVVQALNMAIKRRKPAKGLIVHSDRGSQYCSHAYRDLITQHQLVGSMSARGNCYDNAPIESFWATLKNELVYHQHYVTRAEAIKDIQHFIEIF